MQIKIVNCTPCFCMFNIRETRLRSKYVVCQIFVALVVQTYLISIEKIEKKKKKKNEEKNK